AHERSGDDTDAVMGEVIEVVHRVGGRLRVVDVHAGYAKPRAELAAVDDRRAPRGDAPDERLRRLRQPVAEKDQAVGFFPSKHQRIAFFARLVVLRVAEENGIAIAVRPVFDPLKDEREEWIGDVRYGDEQFARSERAEMPGRRVRRVAEIFNGLQ